MRENTGAMAPAERRLAWVLAAIQFTHIVDFMVMMPLGPQLTALFRISDAQFGLLVSSYTLAAGASGLLASVYIDRFGRRRLLFWMYAGFALATLGCALAPSYGTLMAARIVTGLFGGVLSSLVQTIIADAVPYERRGQATGIVMSAFSMATVAGVPAALALATWGGWHLPFFVLAAMSLGVCALVRFGLPPLEAHLQARARGGALQALRAVLADGNHWRAFALTAALMASAFGIIPYITIYLSANLGLEATQIPWVYLCGGVATFASARLIGWLADRHGKLRVFRAVSVLALVPMLVFTHLPPVSLALVLVVTTLFFVLVSGRMTPAQALVGAAGQPATRGAFLSLNGAVQSAAMALASWVGGLCISRDAQGQVVGYATSGWIAAGLTLLALWLAGRVVTVPETRTQAAELTALEAQPSRTSG